LLFSCRKLLLYLNRQFKLGFTGNKLLLQDFVSIQADLSNKILNTVLTNDFTYFISFKVFVFIGKNI